MIIGHTQFEKIPLSRNGRLPCWKIRSQILRFPLKKRTSGRTELYHQAVGKNKEESAGEDEETQ